MNIYKVDDIVVCLSDPNPNPVDDRAMGGSGFKRNRCFKIDWITDRSTYSNYQILWGHNSNGVYNNSVRYATEAEIHEYSLKGEFFSNKKLESLPINSFEIW